MKLSQILMWSTLGGVLLCSVTSSSALTLGRVRGAAILGQPLELTVPVQIAADEDVSGLCFEAEVFYGDNRQDAGRVVVTNETSRLGLPAVVRIVAYTHVDEPLVTVYLRSGCGQQTMRRYVLLADLVSEVVPTVVRPAVVPDPGFASGSQAVVQPLGKGRGQRANTEAVPRTTNSESSRRQSIPQTTRLIQKQATELRNSKSSAGESLVGKARLQLAMLDLAQDFDPALKISNELIFSLTEDVKKREEAKNLWRALNASPEDVLRGSTRVQDMENSVKLLQDQTSKNRLVMLELAGRLDKAQSLRYFNPLIYGLIAMLGACGAALAYGWRRWHSSNAGAAPWWRDQNVQENAEEGGVERVVDKTGPLQATPNPVVTTDPAIVESPGMGLTEVDIDLQLAEAAFSDLGKPAPFQSEKALGFAVNAPQNHANGHRDFTHSMPGSMREIHSQEMLDARQQADFFMTLGRYEDAIQVLEACAHDSGESNPLVYLDLLKIFHTLSRKADYDRYRIQFNRLFTGYVPEFSTFNDSGGGIEDYADVCEQIVALWPSKDALAYIEKCMGRAPEPAAVQEFQLGAYRDLLMLHGVARQLTSPLESGLSSFGAARTPVFPVQSEVEKINAAKPVFGASGVRIDLDLSEPMANGIAYDVANSLLEKPVFAHGPDR